jgi:hypothetical protein
MVIGIQENSIENISKGNHLEECKTGGYREPMGDLMQAGLGNFLNFFLLIVFFR